MYVLAVLVEFRPVDAAGVYGPGGEQHFAGSGDGRYGRAEAHRRWNRLGASGNVHVEADTDAGTDITCRVVRFGAQGAGTVLCATLAVEENLDFCGFFIPVDNTVLNIVKGGSAVPV